MSEPIMDTVIDVVESLAASMEKEIVSNQLRLTPECCIFRTPTILSRHNEEAYVPVYFSFGPFHHSQPNLQASKEIKLKYLGQLLRRSKGDSDAMLKACLNSINERKEEARSCYAENLDCSDKQLVEMLVLDGCFIIELFRRESDVVPYEEDDDPVSSMSCMFEFLHHDLILLENQIPWLVLKVLFEITKQPSETMSLVQLALIYFGHLFSGDIVDHTLFDNVEINHIIDLLLKSLTLPLQRNVYMGQPGWLPISSATRLREAGVTFVRADKPKSILDIKYRPGGVVEIPYLEIDESTEIIFRNLISYEQCLPNCATFFTAYAKIMDNLIDTEKDMGMLCEKKVFKNWLSPEDATQFFNKLYMNACVNEFFFYYPLCINLNQHCDRRWPKWRAALVHNYFTKPWAIVAIIYATIMLLLTLLPVFLK